MSTNKNRIGLQVWVTKLETWAVTPDVYSEPIQTSQIEPSARINYRFKSTLFVESSTPETWLGSA